MRTLKKIGFILVLITFGLILYGCDTYESSYASPEGLNISIQGADSDSSVVIVNTEKKSFTVDPNDDIQWFYDVPKDQLEYVIVQYALGDNNIRYLYIHQWIDKKPKNFK